MSASWLPCAWRRRGPRPRIWWPRSTLISIRCPPCIDMLAARQSGAPLVHEPWGDNLFLTTAIDVDFEAVKAKAAISVTRELRTARQAMCPLEGRGVIANWNTRLDQLIVTSSTQQPHIVRTGLAECLGLDEGQVRVVAPDVGGGFGYKGILLPEEICAVVGHAKARLPAAVARGSARKSDRRRRLPRAPLHSHRLRRRQRQAAGARLRGHRRFRRLLGLSLLGVPGGGADRLHPAGPLRFPALSLPHLVGRHQQAADPALPRRGAYGRVLRPRGHARCAGPRARHRAERPAVQQPGAS